MKNKVYCKNCKFETFRRRTSYCSRDEKINTYTGYMFGVGKDFTVNIFGNCKYYQKKWWKFWL